tara:strand:+ start:2517 stop:2816 length:300 start_codon:yes stop_codon:yes gene_type:complete
MKTVAILDENNVVTNIVCVNDNHVDSEKYKEFRDDGYRKNNAVIGGTYDSKKDAFIHPKPHKSWSLNNDTCQWESPIAHPDDGNRYDWNEKTQSWDTIT